MRCLVDTGVLLRLFDRKDPQCVDCRRAIATILKAGHELVSTVQNSAEFVNVSTRPSAARGGYGHDVELTLRRLKLLESAGTLLTESKDSYLQWKKLVEDYSVTGVSVHDARLVAVMLANGVAYVLSLNASDFERYSDISVLTPQQVVQDGWTVESD